MISKEQIAHELALIHAQEKYHEFCEVVAPEDRTEEQALDELTGFYLHAKDICLKILVDD